MKVELADGELAAKIGSLERIAMAAAMKKGGAKRAAKHARPSVSEDDEAAGLLTGQFLIAMPAMNTPHFAQTVIYLCAHTADGAMGIVVNRPLASPSFEDLLEQLDVEPVPPMRRINLFRGGPMDSARGFVLHTSDWTSDGSLLVGGRMALTASLDVLKAIADGGGPRQGMLALGYAGWGPGQLDQEMQENAWLTAPASVDLLFDGNHETKWRRAMGLLKIDPLLLSGSAGHA
jgi:putative transcriptional regulator